MNKSICILAILISPWYAKVNAASPSGNNLIENGDFKAFTVRDNYWDGVDSAGYLSGNFENATTVPLLTLSGGVGNTAVPASVCAVDLNGDGLVDLVTASTAGYVFAYFNSGTKTEPKFTNAEVLPLYLARGYIPSAASVDRTKTLLWRKAPRINLFDWTRSGKLDLVAGNYRGEILFIPNKGTRSVPDFRQPPLDDAEVLTTNKAWGNLFSPVAYDFDGDGRVDVAFGEGSYSANSIHLFLNKGTSAQPKFDESAHHYLAFGNGNEQLAPTLADYNGDGLMDLLVGDREGKVAVYLNPGKMWKPGVEFKFSNTITFGSSERLGGAVTLSAGDFNGDGLFDLVISKGNGRIALALNKGTKEAPKFDAAVDLKGVDVWTKNIKFPPPASKPNSGWSWDAGNGKGNPYGYFSVVNNQEDPAAAIPGERQALKAGFFPSPNVVVKTMLPIFPGTASKGGYFAHNQDSAGNHWWCWDAGYFAYLSSSNEFVARYILAENAVKPGKSYRLSFNVKGANLSKGEWKFAYQGRTRSEEKLVHGDRGAVQKSYVDLKVEEHVEEGGFTANSSWSDIHKTITMQFREPDLKNAEKFEAIMAVLEIRATLRPYDGLLYVDDVKLVEQ